MRKLMSKSRASSIFRTCRSLHGQVESLKDIQKNLSRLEILMGKVDLKVSNIESAVGKADLKVSNIESAVVKQQLLLTKMDTIVSKMQLDLTALPPLAKMAASSETKFECLNKDVTTIKASLAEVTNKTDSSNNVANEAKVKADLLYTMAGIGLAGLTFLNGVGKDGSSSKGNEQSADEIAESFASAVLNGGAAVEPV